jgi:hypothetical protein
VSCAIAKFNSILVLRLLLFKFNLVLVQIFFSILLLSCRLTTLDSVQN